MLASIKKRLHISTVSLLTAIRLVWRSSPFISILLLIVIFVQSALPIMLLYAIGHMVDEITDVLSEGTLALTDNVTRLVILVGAITLSERLIGAVATMLYERQVLVVSDYMMSTIHEQSIHLDLEYYENPEYYDMLHRVQADAPYRPAQVVNDLMQTARNAFFLVGIVGLLTVASPWIPIILLVSAVPSMIVRYLFSRKLYSWRHAKTEKERKSSYYHILMTSGAYAKELRLFGIGNLFSAIYDDVRTELREERLRIVARRTISDISAQAFAVVALFGTLLLVLSDVLAQALTIGSFVVVFQAFQRGQNATQTLLSNLASLYEHNLFLRDYQTFIKLDRKIISAIESKPIPNAICEGIRFENVSFHYPGKAQYVLKNVNLTIGPGEVVALVGENGAGKTTLIKLLCRLYDPTEGLITIDGIDIREFNVSDLRRLITVMFQDYNRYHMTVRDNIWLSDTWRTPAENEIIAAANSAGVDEIVAGLENDYDTMLGFMFADSQELSIGQWQKVALARTFWREAPIVVLDEPSSSLDASTEHYVFERFQEIIDGRSAIIISHRLSTVHMAHHIYVLDQGAIVESGTHSELIVHNGIYAHLFNLQSQHYTG